MPALFSLVVLSVTLTPIRATNDAWWHLKAGKVLWERGLRLPEFDLFTWTGETTPWHNHEWLAQVVFWGFYRAAEGLGADGLLGLIVGRALVILAAFLIVLAIVRRESGSWGWALLWAVVLLAVARRTLYPRPPVFSYLFQAAFIWMLVFSRPQRREAGLPNGQKTVGRRRLAVLIGLPALTALWANLHGGFLIGLVLIGLLAAAEGLEWIWRRWGAGPAGGGAGPGPAAGHFRRGAQAAGLLGLCAAAALLTPFGYHLYLLPARVMSNERLVRVIGELQSPDFHFTHAFEALLLLAPVGVAAVRRKAPPVYYLLLWLFFGHQALQHVRHLPVFAIAAAPLIGWVGGGLRQSLVERKEGCAGAGSPRFLVAFEVLCLAAFALASVFLLTDRREGGRSFLDRNRALLAGGQMFEDTGYPKDACDFILAHEFTGRMYNQINNAGYLIWRLSPEHHKVFTDSRFDIWGDRFVWDADAIKDGSASVKQIKGRWVRTPWWDLLDQYQINFIVIGAGEGLNDALRERGGWALVYAGADNIWVRDVPHNAALIRQARATFRAMTGVDLAAVSTAPAPGSGNAGP
ncbi:MAG: hypothetical protein Kow0059_05350 [Candidatus Sumerlaeia bacterium]